MWYWKKLSPESKSSNGNDFIVLFKVDLLHFININLLESVAKMLKSIAECFTFLRRFPVRLEIPMRSLALVQKLQKAFPNVLIKTSIFHLLMRLQKTSSRCHDQDQFIRPGHTSSRRFQGFFKTSSGRLVKTSSKHLQDVLKTSCQNVFKTFSIRLQDVFKTSSRRFQDIFNTSC